MNRLWIIIFIFGIYNALLANSFDALKINEFMASNIYSQLNPDYSDFEDWIELYNSGDTPVSLSGIFLSDDFSSPLKWQLPHHAVIPPKGFFIIWADDLDHDNHASFKLSETGEQIALYRSDGTVIDSVTFGEQQDDVSYGRFPDGSDTWHFFAQPTFNRSNAAAGVSSSGQASPPDFSPEGGLYPGAQYVTISAVPGATIRYTVDGSLPTLQSSEYNGPIFVDRTMVLRARAFQDNMLPSQRATHTYIINEPATLPLISITTPPEFLFDKKIGITVGISVADTIGAPPPFDPHANFWKKWERPVHIEYFEPDGDIGFKQDAGIAIFGGLFGRQIRQKAFTLFARDKYGDSDFDYPLFPDKSIDSFKRFLLRCSSNDFNSTYIRDAMMNTLVIGQMDVDYQAYQPALVYINGTFWGLYNIREKTNQFYPESNYNIDADNVDLIEGIDSTAHGDGSHYQQLIQFVKTNDMTLPLNYQYVQTQMDVSEFMNYFIAEIYVNNQDWLHQNIKCWREHSATGKWRWLLYDLDWGFGGEDVRIPTPYVHNAIQWVLEHGEASILFQRLILNEDFKKEFAQRFATHLNLTFNPPRVHRIIDKMVQRITPEMPRQIERWGAIQSMAYWHEHLHRLFEFAQNRPPFVFRHLEETLHLDGKAELVIEVSDSAAGWITVNEIPGPTPILAGLWFKNIPLRIQAHPNMGWRFVRWEGKFPSNSDRISLTLTDHTYMFAVFEPSGLPTIVISEIHYHPSTEFQGDGDMYEFVELVNLAEHTVDLSGYQFTNGISFTFPQGSSISGGEYIVIAKTATTYTNNGYQVFQIASGKLDNAGEELVFCDSQGAVVDSVCYNDQAPWPTKPDGEGPSLELKNPSLDNNIATAWSASEQTGGTPGRKNSITGVAESNQISLRYELFPAWPNPFNPNTSIKYSLPDEIKVTIEIFNLTGQRVALLVDESQQPGLHTIAWVPGNLPSGIYFVCFSTEQYSKVRKILYIK
ncbi:MAG: CotH kinase family protein [bacterium]|nr:CotH kinase family protein [bacterium]